MIRKKSKCNCIYFFLFIGISVARARGSPLKTQQGLRITEDLAQRVEVVYVLGLFLLGKHRKKVSHIKKGLSSF